jgi:glycosyltransferase involved in cell wall biosynthesis
MMNPAVAKGPLRTSPPVPTSPQVTDLMLSIIVTSHRRREYVRTAVESALTQEAPPGSFEVILTAAGPVPELEDLRAAGCAQIVDIDSEQYGAELVAGVRASRGDVLCLLDDDDAFEPNKVSVVSELFRADPTLGFYSNDFRVMNGSGVLLPGHPLRRRTHLARGRAGLVRVQGPDALGQLARFPPLGPDFNHSSISVRRGIVEPVLAFLERVRLSADSFLFFAALRAGAGIRIDGNTLTRYRLHGQNVSNPQARDPEALRQKLYRHAQDVLASYDVIREMVTGGPPEIVRAIEEAIRFQEVYSLLRSPSAGRRAMWRTLSALFGGRDRYIWKAERMIVPLGLLFELSPTVARRTYLRTKIRELARGSEPT